MKPAFQVSLTLAAVLLLGASTARSQDVGGSGPTAKPGKTVETQQQYIRAMMADKRPVEAGQKSNLPANFYYRQLTVNDKFPINFTCNDAAVKAYLGKGMNAWDVMEALANEIEAELHHGERGFYLNGGLHKVKEISLTITPLSRDANNKVGGPWLYSFNSSTGVVTVAWSTAPGEKAAGNISPELKREILLDQWMLAHMTNAPRPRPDDSSVASGDDDSSSSSASSSKSARNSQVKKWTCTWCHETVESATRPSLDGCPRNKSGQHAWHN